ncbi:MAG: DUF1801 domain-containing protein [Holophaga sp.]|nr:DUF1801 domain-containing protein [Holophaga sp.]
MVELKTKPSDQDVEVFFEAILDAGRREDCRAVARLMQRLTGASPILWGGNILGFGAYRYRYASGREGDWFQTGLAARKHDMSLYLMGGLAQQTDLLARLGKHKMGKGCLYLKRLADVDAELLNWIELAYAEAGN